jgi:hypothetical protein
MKSTKYILLVIGVVALITSLYGIVTGDVFTDYWLGIVCGASLIFGYFEFKKMENGSSN